MVSERNVETRGASLPLRRRHLEAGSSQLDHILSLVQRFLHPTVLGKRLAYCKPTEVLKVEIGRTISVRVGSRNWFAFDMAVGDNFSIVEVGRSIVDRYHKIVINSYVDTNESRHPYMQKKIELTISVHILPNECLSCIQNRLVPCAPTKVSVKSAF
jgi:hypothetical protein